MVEAKIPRNFAVSKGKTNFLTTKRKENHNPIHKVLVG